MLFFLAIFSSITNNRQRYLKVSPIIDSDTAEKSIADTPISILLHKSIGDTDSDTTKVSLDSIVTDSDNQY
jgi:hypothetical protein